ncbi:MAG: flagellar hook-basal body complex protein FliE [Blastocatellia bacterium]|nr:flagellar hook-basal body complex protein FliE [Blastocatellia bacterium]
MMIDGINAALAPAAGATIETALPAASGGESFGSLVRGAVEELDRSQRGAEAEIARAVAGESPDLHRTIVALQSADLTFQLALQVRNKVVGAYEEIMRMQV